MAAFFEFHRCTILFSNIFGSKHFEKIQDGRLFGILKNPRWPPFWNFIDLQLCLATFLDLNTIWKNPIWPPFWNFENSRWLPFWNFIDLQLCLATFLDPNTIWKNPRWLPPFWNFIDLQLCLATFLDPNTIWKNPTRSFIKLESFLIPFLRTRSHDESAHTFRSSHWFLDKMIFNKMLVPHSSTRLAAPITLTPHRV